MSLGALLLTAILAGLIYALFRKSPTTDKHTTPAADPVGTLQGLGSYKLEVVGESHYQSALESLSGGRTRDGVEKYMQAHLVLEDTNSHDSNAVRIDINGKAVGYLSREMAIQYRNRLREAGHSQLGGVCNAVIRGGWDRGPKGQGYFGVWLDLPSA
jgi:hypothetical protein